MKYKIVFTLISTFSFLFFSSPAVHAATYTVTETVDTEVGTCDSNCTLREAVIAANDGGEDTIIIPADTYQFTRTTSGEDAASQGDLDLTDSDLTTIIGAGSGLGGGATIIDGNADRVFHVLPGAAASLSNLSVIDSALIGAGENGAGIFTQGNLTLSNAYIWGNVLTTAGSTNGYGAGIACIGASSAFTMTDSIVDNNLGVSTSGNVYGGGVAIGEDCTASLDNVDITNNEAMYGGGVHVNTASVTTASLYDMTISNNIAGDAGGGVSITGNIGSNPLTIERALLEANQASAGGGIFALGPVSVTNASFYDNHATDTGGAFSAEGSGQAIRLAFVTMTRNTAVSVAGGIYGGGITPDLQVKNSIIAANYLGTATVDDLDNANDCNGDIISGDYNYIAAAQSCNFTQQANDLYNHPSGSVYYTASPTDEGGDVEVTALWAQGETLDLIPSASCTDFNDAAVITDASGVSRPQNTRCDLGAYEKPDTVTQTPTLISPTPGSAVRSLGLQYTLPENPTPGSVTVAFTGSATRTVTMGNSTSVDTTLNLASLSSTSGVASVTGGIDLPDGTYTVTLSYRDDSGNTAQTAVATGVVIDTVTQSPGLLAPGASSMNQVPLEYTLPETPMVGSVRVTFTNTVTSGTTVFQMENNQSVDLTFDPTESGNQVNFDNIFEINTITPSPMPVLADGTYTVTLSYQDVLGNSAATTVVTGVVIDTTTQAPVLTAPVTGARLNSPSLVYTLPESPFSGTVRVVFDDGATTTTLTMGDSTNVNTSLELSDLDATTGVVSASASSLSDGTYTVTLRYQDLLGNPFNSTIATGVVIDREAPTISLLGSTSATITVGETYVDPGYTATDAMEGDMSDSVVVLNTVNKTAPGTYPIYYTLTDSAGNVATQAMRTITVVAETTPIIVPPDTTNTDFGKITTMSQINNQLNVTYANDQMRTFTPYGTSKNFRAALSNDKKRIVITNGKDIRVIKNGAQTNKKNIGKKEYKRGEYSITIENFYKGYDNVIVAAAHGKTGRLHVGRLTNQNKISKLSTHSMIIKNASATQLRVNSTKKMIKVVFGPKKNAAQQTVSEWNLKKTGKLKKEK